MPFKVEVIDYLDELESGVQSICAVNTVINDNGYLIGYNTDYLAAKEVLDECLGIDLYILGNGGYSRAVQQAAKDLGYKPNIISRSNWKDIKNIKDSIVYNCTPIRKIKVDKSFMQKFVAGKGALADTDNFTVLTDDKGVKVVIGYAEINTNRVTLPVERESYDKIDNVSFNANLFRDVLVANKECESATLEVSSGGLARINFKIDEYDATYYLVAEQDV